MRRAFVLGDAGSEAACVAAGGPPSACHKAAEGDYSGAASDTGAVAGAGACTAAGFPEAAPLCGYVGGQVAGKIYEGLSSLAGGASCSSSNWVCTIPPPEPLRAQVVAKLAQDPNAFSGSPPVQAGGYAWPSSSIDQLDGVINALSNAATYQGFGPDDPLPANPPAGTLRRALWSALYLRALAKQPLSDSVTVGTSTPVADLWTDTSEANCGQLCAEYFKSAPDFAAQCPQRCSVKYACLSKGGTYDPHSFACSGGGAGAGGDSGGSGLGTVVAVGAGAAALYAGIQLLRGKPVLPSFLRKGKR